MSILVVVDRAEDWPLEEPGVEVVPARRYLTDPSFTGRPGTKVFNLCRRYRYQSLGYYVSLLAAARGHRPLPSVATIEDLRHRSLVKLISEDLEEAIQRSLKPIAADLFTLSIYFGRNMAERHTRLARQLFNLFPAPLLRAEFERQDDGDWELQSLRPIAAREIPPQHQPFVLDAARAYFRSRGVRPATPKRARYDLAILVDPDEEQPPSSEKAIKKFVRAGEAVGFAVEVIGPEDLGRIAEFDALFIRWTTAVNHTTYRFARRAAAEGLVVIDDPGSIVRCSNKVFLAEALGRARIPTPKTAVLHRDNLEEVEAAIGFPCILKRPDGSFSRGVVRVDTHEAFLATARDFLEDSDLLIAQEYLPTSFDWRVGVLGGEALFAARYGMADGHWQIVRRDAAGKVRDWGTVRAVPLDEVPPPVLVRAVAAARLMGDGLYGVDLKERDGEAYVIEVNDNPNLDAGFEDALLGDELYRRVMALFMERVESAKVRTLP